MALKETTNELRKLLNALQADIEKADGGNKAASQRVRTSTVRLEKVAKRYRKESIVNEKKTKGVRKPAKKAAKPKAASKGKSARAKMAKPKAMKSRGKSSHASVGFRALSIKKPTAKLPVKRIRF